MFLLPGGATVVSGFVVGNSLSLDGTNDDMSRTLDGDQRLFTISTWLLSTDVPTTGRPYFSRTTNEYITRAGVAPNKFAIKWINYNYGGETTSTFTSTTDWYHVVVQVDTAQADLQNRINIFVDNVENDLVGTPAFNDPPLNHESTFWNNSTHYIGGLAGSTPHFKGNLSEFYGISGQKLAPSAFGVDDGGTWSPQAFTGSYGSNDFYLNFSNGSDLGEDFSGEGNDWTNNGCTQSSTVPPG